MACHSDIRISETIAQTGCPSHDGPVMPIVLSIPLTTPPSSSMTRQMRALATIGVTTGMKNSTRKNGAQSGSECSQTAIPVDSTRFTAV